MSPPSFDTAPCSISRLMVSGSSGYFWRSQVKCSLSCSLVGNRRRAKEGPRTKIPLPLSSRTRLPSGNGINRVGMGGFMKGAMLNSSGKSSSPLGHGHCVTTGPLHPSRTTTPSLRANAKYLRFWERPKNPTVGNSTTESPRICTVRPPAYCAPIRATTVPSSKK
jgi:hypothetical protein